MATTPDVCRSLDGPLSTPRPPARDAVIAHRPSVLSRALGGAGEVLITLGVVVLLYVVWQVGWTSVAAGGETRRALEAIAAHMEPPFLEAAREDHVFGADVAPPIVQPDENGGLGVLHVPVWGADYAAPILDGVSEDVLATGGAGRYEETALPGEVGNAALAGHRLTRGNPFLHIDRLSPGDPVVVETAEAWLVYTVRSDEVVLPADVDVLLPVPRRPGAVATERLLTLTTCHPITSRSQRWVTYLQLSHWTPRAAGVPTELAQMAAAQTSSYRAEEN